jgi:hypothetical protein
VTTTLEFPDDHGGWVESLPSYQRVLIHELLSSGLDEEAVAEAWLSRTGPDNNFGFGTSPAASNYLASVKAEFRKFICGDPTYEALRQDAQKVWNGTKYPIVSVIAIGIASQIGVAVAVITPVVALLLAAVGKIGLNAWCNMPPPPTATLTPG